MNYRLLSTINAIILAVFGVVFFVIPDIALGFFDTETYTATSFVARFFGAVMVLAGMFIWLARDLAVAQAEKTMTIMLLVSSIAGFILTLIGMVGLNVIRTNGWILLVIHILFALGYGYLVSGVSIEVKNQPKK
jgi:hypothetical protein